MRHSIIVLAAALGLAGCDQQSSLTGVLARARANGSLGTGSNISDMGLLPGAAQASAYGVNNGGLVVGYTTVSTGAATAFGWTSAQGMTALGVPLGWGESYAFAVNDGGTIAGAALTPQGVLHAVSWSGGVMKDLGAFTAGGSSLALGVGSDGRLVGQADALVNGALVPHAFLYGGSTMIDLGTLGGRQGSAAQDVNASGVVVGGSYLPDGTLRAFRWQAGAGMVVLPALSGQRESFAVAINAGGDIIGFVTMAADNLTRAVIWPRTGGVAQLAGLANNVATLAFDINDRGEIVGYSQASNGQRFKAVWWVPGTSGGYGTAEDLKAKGGVTDAYAQAISPGTGGQPTRVVGISVSARANRGTLWR
ncbi:MAG TPA: hypothetical protein VFS05_05975 [Gemmatimonadaceae bacterium]|nr:hypothetical protein [Gemmatimonadaceae bacterium]